MNECYNEIKNKKGIICDMDGVIYHGNQLLPGAKEFVDWLRKENKRFLFLTNSSEKTPLELSQKLARMGLEVSKEHFYNSALATASFIKSQKPNASVFCIGEGALQYAIYEAGLPMNDINPDYVVMGETNNYNYQSITKAIQLVINGARLIGTNPDITSPGENDITVPACKALIAPIEIATGKKAYFLGKPNPLMMRTGLDILGVHSADAVIIGDRMDTDIIAGIQSSVDTVLVLTGVTTSKEMLKSFPYRPKYIFNSIGDIAKI